MKINRRFFEIIKPTLVELQKKFKGEFVVFGSSPLYLLGVLPFAGLEHFNDLDVAIKEVSAVPPEAKQVTFHGNPDQKLYKLTLGNIEVDMGGIWPGQEDYFYKLFENPIIVDDFKFANLDICQEWKERMIKKYDRQKDKEYLDKILEFKRRLTAK